MSTPMRKSKRPRLTAAILVCDPQDDLAATMLSVAPIADEIIVVDTQPGERALRIPIRHTAKVLKFPWIDDYAAARNRGLQEASGQWVLALDAGETIPAEDSRRLRDFVDTQAATTAAYYLRLVLPAPHPSGSAEQASRLRLIPFHASLRYEGRVRETLLPAIEAAGLMQQSLDCRIQRPARDHHPAVKFTRAERDLQLAELEIRERGERPELALVLAESLAVLGRSRGAAEAFRRAIRFAPLRSTTMLEGFYGLLTTFDQQPDQRETQINVCLEAIETFPLDAQLLCAMGSYLLAENRLELAQRAYQICASHGQIDPQSWHLCDLDEVAATCLGIVEQLLGREDLALAAFEQALERRPDSARLRRRLIQLHIKSGRAEAAIDEVSRLPESVSHREALPSAIRGAILAMGQQWEAALPYLSVAYAAGCRDPLCLRPLAITYLSLGDLERAEPILIQWREQDPSNAEIVAYQEAVAEHRATMAGAALPASNELPVEAMSGPTAPARGAPARPRRIRVDADRDVGRPAVETAIPKFSLPSPGPLMHPPATT